MSYHYNTGLFEMEIMIKRQSHTGDVKMTENAVKQSFKFFFLYCLGIEIYFSIKFCSFLFYNGMVSWIAT